MTATAIEERVIRRFIPRTRDIKPLLEAGDMLGVAADVETLGLNYEKDAIIQLALTPFAFTADGKITGVAEAFAWHEDPGVPIPPEITKLTGITNEMVARQRIADGTVKQLIPRAKIVIAHKADFDRPFLEKRLPVFEDAVFGCSMVDVPWLDEGYQCRKLRCLMLEAANLDFDGHTADADCYAALHLMTTVMPTSGLRALSHVLAASRVSHARVYATGARFEFKDALKQRGYSWDPAGKVWYRDVIVGEDFTNERIWLMDNICPHPMSAQFDAKKRFSNRI